MYYVVCALENASENINGVPFKKVEGIMMSVDPVSEDVANSFCQIVGYDKTPVDPEELAFRTAQEAAAKARVADAAARIAASMRERMEAARQAEAAMEPPVVVGIGTVAQGPQGPALVPEPLGDHVPTAAEASSTAAAAAAAFVAGRAGGQAEAATEAPADGEEVF